MFDSHPFEKALKAANKIDKILRASANLRTFSGLERTLSTITQSTEQAERLLQRTRMLTRENIDLARRSQGLTKQMYDRVKFYDQEIAAVRRTRGELQNLARIEVNNFSARKQQLLQSRDLSIRNIRNEIANRNNTLTNLGHEYNLRLAIEGASQKVNDIATEMGTHNTRLLELQTRLRAVEADRAKIAQSSSDKLLEYNKKLQEQEDIERAINDLKSADKTQLKAKQKQDFKDSIKELFTAGPLGAIFKNIGKLGLLFAPLYILAKIIEAIIGKYIQLMKTTIEGGYDASQRIDQITQAQRIVAKGLSGPLERRILLDPVEVQKSAQALQEKFGTIVISDDLIFKSAELSRQIGLSASEAADLLEYFIRIGKQSSTAAAFSTVLLKATAIGNKTNPALVMRDVAANAANFAKSGTTSAEQMAKAAIYTRQIGTNLSTVANIADRVVTDFEGTLEAQATIGAFAPGFNMSGLMVASQFGSDDDIARELQASVKSLGYDFKTLPRSFKLAISNSLGVSVDELAKIAGAEEPNLKAPTAADVTKAQENIINELQQGVANPLDTIQRGIFGIWASLVKWFGSSSEKEAARIGSLNNQQLLKERTDIGRLTPDKKEALQKEIDARGLGDEANKQLRRSIPSFQPDGSRVAIPKIESRAVGGTAGVDTSPSVPLSSIFNKLKSNEVPTILHRGEAVLNKTQMNILDQLTSAKTNINTSFGGFIGRFTKSMSDSTSIFSKIGSIFGATKSQAPQLPQRQTQQAARSTVNQQPSIISTLDKISGGFVSKITSSAGGLLGKISGLFGGGKKAVGKSTTGVVDGLLGKVGGLFGIGKKSDKPSTDVAGGLLSKISGLFGGSKKPTQSPSGPLLSTIASGSKSTGLMNSLFTSGKDGKGGLLSKLSSIHTGNKTVDGLLGSASGALGKIGSIFSPAKGGILGKIGSLFGGKKDSGALSKATSILSGGKTTGVLGKVESLIPKGGLLGKVGSLLGGKDGKGGVLSSITSKIPGLGGLLSGKGGVKGVLSNLASGGLKKLAGGAIAKLGGAQLGATLGSVIPGAGTIIGALAGAGISKLMNSKVGKAVGKFIGKTPIGFAAKKLGGLASKALGGIGHKLGGLFHRKKKHKPTPVPTPASIQPDITQLAGSAGGMANFMAPMGVPSAFSSGINFTQPSLMNQNQPMMGSTSSTNSQGVEQRLDKLIGLLQAGAIAVNMDGKKVSESLVDANRYG